MCCKGFWKKIVAFILTFGLGIFVSSFFTFLEVDRQDVISPKVVFESQEILRKAYKPVCKKYLFSFSWNKGMDKFYELENERLEIENFLKSNKYLSQIEKEMFRQKLKENEDEFVELMENFFAPPPPNDLNLVKYCDEY